jgi:hypothetical protein
VYNSAEGEFYIFNTGNKGGMGEIRKWEKLKLTS